MKNCIDAVKDDLKKLTDKHIDLSDEKYDLSFIKIELSNREKSIVARKNKKQELIEKIRFDYIENGLTKTEISKKYKLEFKTVNRYLTKDATIPRRNNITKLNGYAKEIYSMLKEQSNSEYNYRSIYSRIAELGYDESYENFYKQLRLRIIDNDLHSPLTIGRNQFHKLLYNKSLSDLSLSKECEKMLSLFLQQDNTYSQALELISCFSSIIKKESSLEIEKLISMVLNSTRFEKWFSTKTFFEGVNRDIVAVKNQINIKETNSTIEGFVSKIKTIKKRTFGRASFSYLKSLLLLP